MCLIVQYVWLSLSSFIHFKSVSCLSLPSMHFQNMFPFLLLIFCHNSRSYIDCIDIYIFLTTSMAFPYVLYFIAFEWTFFAINCCCAKCFVYMMRFNQYTVYIFQIWLFVIDNIVNTDCNVVFVLCVFEFHTTFQGNCYFKYLILI